MGKFSNTHLQLKSDTCFFHEAMHTLGFTHEFNAVDRNKYVNVHFNNVREGEIMRIVRLKIQYLSQVLRPHEQL